MERECLYFQWRNGKCFKYVVEDRRRKKYVYGIAYCNEPGVPIYTGIYIKTLIHYQEVHLN